MTLPTPSFGPNGFVVPPEPDILVARKEEINEAFGGGLNMADKTPQGQIAVTETAAIGNANASFVFLSQMFDPAYSMGRYQDAIGRIYFIERFPARPTSVQVVCGGLVGVVIPVGSQVQADDGSIFVSTEAGVIGPDGTVTLSFANATPGPIPCPAGSISVIYRSIVGWDSVTNPADGAIGRNTETRAEFEDRRRLSVAHNGAGATANILGAVLSVDNVLDAICVENVDNNPTTIKGYTLQANSIYVAATGGNVDDVAKAIWSKKSPGCGYNGNTAVVVYDEDPAYDAPYPAYTVRYEIPAENTISFVITLANSDQVPANVLELVQAAIVDAFAGGDGGPRARIAGLIFASRYYAPIQALGSWAQIVTVKLGSQNLPNSVFVASIADTALTVSALTSGIIQAGQQVVGPGVVPGTTIIGGSGTDWIVDTTQTVASATMSGIVASYDEVSMNLDQQPVTAPGNISVILI